MTDNATQSTEKNARSSAERPFAIAVLLTTFAAFLAASCCVLPFIFIALGLGGSWLAFLDNGLLYRKELQWVAGAVLTAGWLCLLGRGRIGGLAFRLLLMATTLLIVSVLVWEFQGEIRKWLMDLR